MTSFEHKVEIDNKSVIASVIYDGEVNNQIKQCVDKCVEHMIESRSHEYLEAAKSYAKDFELGNLSITIKHTNQTTVTGTFNDIFTFRPLRFAIPSYDLHYKMTIWHQGEGDLEARAHEIAKSAIDLLFTPKSRVNVYRDDVIFDIKTAGFYGNVFLIRGKLETNAGQLKDFFARRMLIQACSLGTKMVLTMPVLGMFFPIWFFNRRIKQWCMSYRYGCCIIDRCVPKPDYAAIAMYMSTSLGATVLSTACLKLGTIGILPIIPLLIAFGPIPVLISIKCRLF